jgi:hypothetical protein
MMTSQKWCAIKSVDQLSAHEVAAGSQQESFTLIDIELVWKEEKDMSEKKPGKFKFDVVIGNPPYQEEVKGTAIKTIYNLFMDEAYKIAERVSFITPARFLFNAGKTPKIWNQKMLEDEHLKVEFFEQDSLKCLEIPLLLWGRRYLSDSDMNSERLGHSLLFELNEILKKVVKTNSESFSNIVFGQNIYQYTDKFHEDYPNAEGLLSNGHKYDVTSNAFDRLDLSF